MAGDNNRRGVSADARLRDAFAQLMAAGQDRSLPPEALWLAQGQRQIPQTIPLDAPPDMSGNYAMPTPRAAMPDPNLQLPTAPQGPGLGTEYRPPAKTQPFPGAKSVEVKPAPRGGEYSLPKSEKKKPQKGKDRG